MRQIQVADLTASANEIDNRMGPIPGRSSDRIANELRWAADEFQRAMNMLGDVPGISLTERLQNYIGCYMALQLKAAEANTIPVGARSSAGRESDIDKTLGELLTKICSHEALNEAMQDAWNDICTDTGCHPLDIEHGKGKHLTFSPNHWANQIAKRLFVRALKLRLEMPAQPQAAPASVDHVTSLIVDEFAHIHADDARRIARVITEVYSVSRPERER